MTLRVHGSAAGGRHIAVLPGDISSARRDTGRFMDLSRLLTGISIAIGTVVVTVLALDAFWQTPGSTPQPNNSHVAKNGNKDQTRIVYRSNGQSPELITGSTEKPIEIVSEAQLVPIRSAIGALEQRLSGVDAGLEADRQDVRDLARRLEQLEAALGPITAAVNRMQTTELPDVSPPVQPSTVPPLQQPITPSQPVESQPPAVQASPPIQPSLQPPEQVTSPIVEEPQVFTRTVFGLELNTYPSIGELEGGWQMLQRTYGKVLNGLEARIVLIKDPSGHPLFRIVAGPISNVADAISRCIKLERVGQPCKYGRYRGQDLTTVASGGTQSLQPNMSHSLQDNGVQVPLPQPKPQP